VSEPGTPSDVPDADRAEQETLVDPPEVAIAGDAETPPADVPEADALEQQLVARPRARRHPLRRSATARPNEADVLEQETDVPLEARA
jgi:hypothetical protein